MKYELKDESLVVYFDGRIDSSNSANVEQEVVEIRDNNPHSSFIGDFENLNYISSAGLRIILRLRKEEQELKIVNVSSEVYDVFEMTGFTEMITIEKAFRNLSVEGCEVIGQGANGLVYRLDPDTIIKVYKNPDSLDDIKRERELARKAFVLGVPTAIPYDVVKVGDKYGSVFELLNANSFSKCVVNEPENRDKYIKLFADLLKQIHSTIVNPNDMPSMKEIVLHWADYLKDHLPSNIFDKLIKMINEVPDDNTMIHGDYHLKNVMLQNGETILIDMDTLCHGNPVFEFGSVFNACKGFSAIDHDNVLNFMGVDYDTSCYVFAQLLKLYFDTTDEKKLNEIEKKAAIVGYTRILRRTLKRHPEKESDIKFYKETLISLIEEVDTLLL